jgi:membrane-bound metal-dependent hydrolase YbcI (DUF457 family)
MAGFKTHVTVSSLCGCGYAGAGYLYGMPIDTALLGGAMCGFSGMLPDLDSDYGTPLRETMAFTAAVLPMLLIHRFAAFGLRPDEIALAGIAFYLFVRFGVTNMVRKYTVHRGMFHSIPAALIFAGVAFLVSWSTDVYVRYYKAGAVLTGFMSHLILDEIYSFEFQSGAWRVKKSFGTAVKLWGDDTWANFSTYAKLIVVVAIILSEPSVLEQIHARDPAFAQRLESLESRYRNWTDQLRTKANSVAQPATAWNPFAAQGVTGTPQATQPPQVFQQPHFAPQTFPPSSAPSSAPYGWPPSPAPPATPHTNTFETARPAWPTTQ